MSTHHIEIVPMSFAIRCERCGILPGIYQTVEQARMWVPDHRCDFGNTTAAPPPNTTAAPPQNTTAAP